MASSTLCVDSQGGSQLHVVSCASPILALWSNQLYMQYLQWRKVSGTLQDLSLPNRRGQHQMAGQIAFHSCALPTCGSHVIDCMV